MSALWITFNFLLTILAFYLILQLYQRIRLLQQTDSKQLLHDVEDIFDAYLEETRKENDRLVANLKEAIEPPARQKSTAKKNHPARSKKADTIHRPAEQNPTPFSQVLKKESELQMQETINSGESVETEQTAPEEKGEWMPPVEDINDKMEESLFLQAMKLKNKGYTTTEIAKELNRGKGEVELLLRFQGKGQS
ncbi:DUF6115 domain-containing protein [Sporolactobacillus pectinivorans]|uniref:DUF6115 domain-containing protein n=1 Tax=Sporolactobacillus pectinivorans TaxID=1591408 RepID=UPI0012FE63F5|nr:hypothetical protein [Sporolactobacillus pectinivorans]